MAAERRVFGTICDGEIEFVSFSEDDWEGAKILLTKFIENESISIGTEMNLPEFSESRDEMIALCWAIAKDGCSILAKVVATGQVVGCVFNKIQYTSDEKQFFEQFTEETCKTENSKALMQFIIDVDAMFNMYEYYNTNCLYEIMFLGTLPEFSRRNIGLEIVKYSIQIGKELKHAGEHLKFLPDDLKNKRPAAAISTFSSKYSQRIGDKLGMEVHAIAYHKDFEYRGKNYMERIPDPTQNKSTLVSLKL